MYIALLTLIVTIYYPNVESSTLTTSIKDKHLITELGGEISLTSKELCQKPIEPSKMVNPTIEEFSKIFDDYNKQQKKNCEPVWSTKKYLGPMGESERYDGVVFQVAEKEIKVTTYKGSRAIDAWRSYFSLYS